MTTLAIRSLLVRLREEADRQTPFSEAKLLFREAASRLERMEAELAQATAELVRRRAERP